MAQFSRSFDWHPVDIAQFGKHEVSELHVRVGVSSRAVAYTVLPNSGISVNSLDDAFEPLQLETPGIAAPEQILLRDHEASLEVYATVGTDSILFWRLVQQRVAQRATLHTDAKVERLFTRQNHVFAQTPQSLYLIRGDLPKLHQLPTQGMPASCREEIAVYDPRNNQIRCMIVLPDAGNHVEGSPTQPQLSIPESATLLDFVYAGQGHQGFFATQPGQDGQPEIVYLGTDHPQIKHLLTTHPETDIVVAEYGQ